MRCTEGNGNTVGGGDAEAEGIDKPATSVEGIAPDPTGMAAGSVEAKYLASGDNAAKDPAKVPVEAAMWSKAAPAMRIINDISDTWERFGNALSPQHPFPYWEPRLKLACPMIPLALITCLVSTVFFLRMATFLSGVVFFGQPLLVRSLRALTRRIPHWQKYLELRRTLLAGVPTNAQLTLTLLRIAEKNKAPLPPPPTSEQPTVSDSDDESDSFDGSSYDVDTDSEDYRDQVYSEKDYADGDEEGAKKRKPGRKLAAALKRTVKAGVGGALGIDHLKAKVGSEPAKNRLGAVAQSPPSETMHKGSDDGSVQSEHPPEVARVNLPGGEGPCVFSARLHGKKGYVILVNTATYLRLVPSQQP
ncbi:uncharacterized protein PHACADRAFT_24598 [Phanerochaete carnosa HHB-10118-sp]|uniref:Uncharacterized protein n=1 Tax=Phanerochaete carnosa (strain HHB-10118-sp) TaxID=650164 RepID=K5VEH4_PHACS|nr:uncharacterized protein PHACADRAFT_24598 [Phanerochaete carnosa HHB-10118-sp]EKM61396.1 hypothetical protein PHACADRAFT_24598 [Phanerochaete carnosa HHB-10118-sp]